MMGDQDAIVGNGACGKNHKKVWFGEKEIVRRKTSRVLLYQRTSPDTKTWIQHENSTTHVNLQEIFRIFTRLDNDNDKDTETMARTQEQYREQMQITSCHENPEKTEIDQEEKEGQTGIEQKELERATNQERKQMTIQQNMRPKFERKLSV